MVRKVLSSVAVAAAFLAGGCSGIGFSETGSELTADDEHNTVGAEGAASEPTDVASEAEPHSSNPESTESLLPPLGKPDFMAPGFELFQLCKEISQEEFEKAGFGPRWDTMDAFSNEICMFGESRADLIVASVAEASNNWDSEYEPVRGAAEEISGKVSEDRCTISIDTVGGSVTVQHINQQNVALEERCERTRDLVSNLTGDEFYGTER